MAVNDKLISQTTSRPTPNSTDLVLLEDATTHEFVNTPLSAINSGGGAVTSVAGKTGVVTLDKADVGLSNVDNTSDANKPVSTAQAASIATKQDTLVSGTNIKTINSTSLLGSGDIAISGATNLTTTTAASTVTVNSDTGTDAVIAAATASVAGILTATDKSKLDGIAAGATANSSDATLLARANHTGSQAQSTITNLVTDLAAKQPTITLTTAGTSGAATLVGATLNIPQYGGGGGGTAGITRSVSSITTNTTAGAVALTDYVYLCTGNLTLTLPTAVGNSNRYSVTTTDGFTTVATTSSQTINGSSIAVLTIANMSLDFISNGSNWIIE